jgi:hypothetical protein
MALLPIPSTIPTSSFYQLALQALYDIAGAGTGGGGGNSGITLPAYNGVVLSNYAAADKPRSIVLKQNGTTVATLTLAYDGSNNLTSIVQS